MASKVRSEYLEDADKLLQELDSEHDDDFELVEDYYERLADNFPEDRDDEKRQ